MIDKYIAEKIQASRLALRHIPENSMIGIGTGSTVNHFIDLLAKHNVPIQGTIASSRATELLLRKHHIPVFELNDILRNGIKIDVYIDGADEYNDDFEVVKGRGGALTREKIIASASDKFVCIVDSSKKVVGNFNIIPLEVIPMASEYVSQEIQKLGGTASLRDGFVTDNGNIIIDCKNLVGEPLELEMTLNNIPGVICNGIFVRENEKPDVIISGDQEITKIIQSN